MGAGGIENLMQVGGRYPAGKPLPLHTPLTAPIREAAPSHPVMLPDRVTFSGATDGSPENKPPQYTPQELDAILEDLNSLNTHNRLDAILKLKKLDRIPNNKLARSLARYLYFNDSLESSGYYRLPARWHGMEVLEKDKSPWAIEALIGNAQEISDKELAKYAISTLSRIYPTLPKRLQDRSRLLLLNMYLSQEQFRTSRVQERLTFLKRYAAPEDANLLWYLMSESGLKDNNNTPLLMEMFTHSMAREHGADYFKLLMEDYRSIRANGTSASGFGPVEASQFLKLSLREFPKVILSRSSSELKQAGREEIEKSAHTLVDILTGLTAEEPSGTDTSDRRHFGEAISVLASHMGEEDRQAFALYLMEKGEQFPKNVALLANLTELAHPGQVTFQEAMEGFVTPKYSQKLDRTESAITDLLSQSADDSPQAKWERLREATHPTQWPDRNVIGTARDGLNAFRQFLDPEAVQERSATRDVFPSRNVSFKPLEPVRNKPLPRGATDLSLTPIPLPRHDELPDMWTESYSTLETTQTRFQESLDNQDTDGLKQHTRHLMEHWLARQSQKALSSLASHMDNPVVTSTFLSYMAELQGTLMKPNAPPFRTSVVTGANLTIPLKIPDEQVMSILERMPHQQLSDLDLTHFRKSILPVVSRRPELRNNALKLTMELYENWDCPQEDEADHGKKALAVTAFNLLKFGTPAWVLRDHKETLKEIVTRASQVYALPDKVDSLYRAHEIDWRSLQEGKQDVDGIDAPTRNDLALLSRLVDQTGNGKVAADIVNRIFRTYLTYRENAYTDKGYIIHLLRQPELVRAIIKTDDDVAFQRYTEMVGWYRVFETVPQLVEYGAEEAPLSRKVRIQTSIAKWMDYYAMPELRELKTDGRTRKIREFARDTLREMSKPTHVSTLHQPMVDTLPDLFRQRLDALKKGKGFITPKVAVADNRPRQSIEDLTSRRQVVIPGAERFIDNSEPSPTDSQTQEPGTTPDISDARPDNPLRTTNRRVRILGVDSLEDIDNLEEARGSFLAQMRDAFAMLQASGNPQRKLEAGQQLLDLAKQFRSLAQGKNGNVKFMTPEKTAFAQKVAQRLNLTRDFMEQGILCPLLGELQDKAAVPDLLRFIRSHAERRAAGEAMVSLDFPLNALQKIGAIPSLEEARTLLDILPVENHRQVLETLASAGDTEGLVNALTQREYPADTTAWLAKTLADKVAGVPELEDRVKPKIVESLRQADGNSQAQLDFIGALYSLADGGDADIARLLTELGSAEDASRDLKRAVVETLEFIDRIPEMTRFYNKIRQENDPELRRIAQERLGNT